MSNILQQIRDVRMAVKAAGTIEDGNIRGEALREARQLLLDLETPNDTIPRICFSVSATRPALKT
jgi:hypothetical protein